MAYAKFDDRYDDHRKMKRAWRRFPPNPVGLHAMAVTYCNRHETDGVIDADWLEEKVPKQDERDGIVAYMVEHKLLDQIDDEHFYVHDFLDWNDSREHREELREAGRKGANARWKGKGSRNADRSSDLKADADADRNGSANADGNSPPHHTTPHHTGPPLPPKGKRKTDLASWRENCTAWAAEAQPSKDESARWAAVLDALPPQSKAFISAAHPHSSRNGKLLLGVEPEFKRLIEDRYSKVIAEHAGDFELVPCGCPGVQG